MRSAPLLRLFELAISGTGGGHGQCLLISSTIELGDSSPEVAGILQVAFADLVSRFREAIERARDENEIVGGVDPSGCWPRGAIEWFSDCLSPRGLIDPLVPLCRERRPSM